MRGIAFFHRAIVTKCCLAACRKPATALRLTGTIGQGNALDFRPLSPEKTLECRFRIGILNGSPPSYRPSPEMAALRSLYRARGACHFVDGAVVPRVQCDPGEAARLGRPRGAHRTAL